MHDAAQENDSSVVMARSSGRPQLRETNRPYLPTRSCIFLLISVGRRLFVFLVFWLTELLCSACVMYVYFTVRVGINSTVLYFRFIPRCTLVCNTLGSNWARSTYTYYVLLYVVHFRILFFSSFSLACTSSGGQILSKNRACKTWCYMYIPREVAPTTRFARLRKIDSREFFLIWRIACNVHLSCMWRF